MKFFALLLVFASLSLYGCSSPTADSQGVGTSRPSDSDAGGPWLTLTDDDYGGIESNISRTDDGTGIYEYKASRVPFGDLLEDISEMTECSVNCDDPSLLNKGVTLTFEGIGPKALLHDLASKLGLHVIEHSPTSFTLSNSGTAPTN